MPLRPAHLDESVIGQPLAYDLYTSAGVLVACAGTQIPDREHLIRLLSRPLFRQADGHHDDINLPARLQRLLVEWPQALPLAGGPALETAMRAHARVLIALAEEDHDACLGLARLLPLRDPAVRHCLLTAIIAGDLGTLMDLPVATLESLSGAALTMNLAAMRLHAELAQGLTSFDAAARAEMRNHPEHGVKLLMAGGLADSVWLTAVRQHHENLDGSGYPAGLRDEAIGLPARILRVADYYAAKISGRHYRPARSVQFAMQRLFGPERGHLDTHLATLLLRYSGLYPPGTLVRLASREIAVVTRKQGNGETAGTVTAFMNNLGHLLKTPLERHTGTTDYAILDVTEAEPAWPEIRWANYWGY